MLASCSYKPVVDTAGRSGTFNENKAHEITDDLQHCQKLAKNNTSFIGNIVYWIGSPEADTEYQSLYRKCLTNSSACFSIFGMCQGTSKKLNTK